MQCEEWADANSELFKEAHDEAVHKNSYKRKLYELISASLEQGEARDITGLAFVSPVVYDAGQKELAVTQATY